MYVLVDKQIYIENHHHQKQLYQENNLNHAFEVSLFDLFVLLILLWMLMFLSFHLTQSYL